MIRVKRPRGMDFSMRNVRIIRRGTDPADSPSVTAEEDGAVTRNKRVTSKRRALQKKRSRQPMQRTFKPSLTILSEFTTLSDDAPSSRSTASQHQRSMDSCDMAYQEYIGTEYGIVTDGMLTGESAVNSADDTLYYENDADSADEVDADSSCKPIGSEATVEAPSPSETSETTEDFIQLMDLEEYDGKWQLALQQAYERGFNKGYSMGVQFNVLQREQFPQRMLSK